MAKLSFRKKQKDFINAQLELISKIDRTKIKALAAKHALRTALFMFPMLFAVFFIICVRTFGFMNFMDLIAHFTKIKMFSTAFPTLLFICLCLLFSAFFIGTLFVLFRNYFVYYAFESTEDHLLAPGFLRSRNGISVHEADSFCYTDDGIMIASNKSKVDLYMQVEGFDAARKELSGKFPGIAQTNLKVSYRIINGLNLVSMISLLLVMYGNRSVMIVAACFGFTSTLSALIYCSRERLVRNYTGRNLFCLPVNLMILIIVVWFRLS